MRIAREIQPLGPDLAFWEAYDPGAKAQCSSCAVRSAAGVVVFDPVRLSEEAALELEEQPGRPVWIALTSPLAARDKDWFARRFGAREAAADSAELAGAGFRALPVPGAAPGETAWNHPGSGLLVIGAALSHDGTALRPLPRRLRSDPRLFESALRELMSVPFRVCCFAAGPPVVARTGMMRLADLPFYG